MVFLDFDLRSWEFWLVMLFDIFLLIARDADLYDDCAIWIKKNSGRIGLLVLRFGELLVGPDMTPPAERVSTQGKPNAEAPDLVEPTETERAAVKREMTENCVVSEMLASMALFTLVATDVLLKAAGMKGEGLITGGMSDEGRNQALAVYTIIMCCQIIGIGVSHQIIHYKNTIAERLRAIRNAAGGSTLEFNLVPGHEWHFFLVSVSSRDNPVQ
jgi:hypothetical protein